MPCWKSGGFVSVHVWVCEGVCVRGSLCMHCSIFYMHEHIHETDSLCCVLRMTTVCQYDSFSLDLFSVYVSSCYEALS